MIFCPKCASIMKPEKDKGGALVCTRCGFVSGLKAGKMAETGKHDANIRIVDTDKEIHPTVKAECPKCGNEEAVFWTQQTRSADEAETRFYRCTKCKHTWREYR